MDDPDPSFLTDLHQARRLMIIGQPGSGKSYLAAKLGDILGLPVVHIDKIHWQPGWVARESQVKMAMARDVHAQDAWIFEGGLFPTWEERLDRCHVLIWLDVPLFIRLWRIARRTWQTYGTTRPDLAENCPERVSLPFYRYVLRSRRAAHGRNTQFFAAATKPKLRLRSAQHVGDLLSRLTP